MFRCTVSALFAVAAAALPLPRATAQIPAADRLALGRLWTFDRPPLDLLQQEHGFRPKPEWLDALRLATLRLGERDAAWGSAAFVSAQGLILTSHQCVRDRIATAPNGPIWLAEGFAAAHQEDEVRIPGLTVQQLVRIVDATAAMDQDIAPTDDADVVAIKRQTNRARVQQEADRAHPGERNEIVELLQGAVVQVHGYRVYDDVRLVLAVPIGLARFGGDSDSLAYPRYAADFALLRAYDRGLPADTGAHFFRWRKGGVGEGESVFAAGIPGSTNRQLTVAQLECLRDVELPLQIEELDHGLQVVSPLAKDNEGLLPTVLEWELRRKALRGALAALQHEARLAPIRAREQRLRQAVDQDPDLRSRCGDAWDHLAALAQRRRALLPRLAFHSPSYSRVIARGLLLAKAFDPSRDELERSAAMQEAMAMRADANPLTTALAVDHFERAARWLRADDPYLAAVAGEQRGRERIDWRAALEAVERSALRDGRFVKQLVDGGVGAFRTSTDPGVVVGRELWPLVHLVELDRQAIETMTAAESARIGRALRAVHGDAIRGDAPSVLRFADGRVQGCDWNGTQAPWATSLLGLWARSAEFAGQPPFELPKALTAARDRLDLDRKLCLAVTNDIGGGMSGACLVDRELRVVGLLFDGNAATMANTIDWTPGAARAVGVHTDAILQCLDTVWPLPRVAAELRAEAR